MLLLGAAAIQSTSPEQGKPERSPDQVLNRTWFDVKKVMTHVETEVFYWEVTGYLASKFAEFKVPEYKKVTVIKAEFVSSGYRTNPPDIVQVALNGDADEIELIGAKGSLGNFKSLPVGGSRSLPSCGQFPIPARIFSEWVAAERPVLKLRGESRELGLVMRDAVRDLARRMVTHKSLTMLRGRESLTATALSDGRVLVVGGYNGFRALRECEIYDPVVGRFAEGPAMKFPRRGHTATMLKNGKILVVGGGLDGGDMALDSAELYDPATNRFMVVGKMRDARMSHTATLLQDGRVLITGGGGKAPLAGAEIYDPTTNSFQPTGNLLHRRLGHTATQLKDGRVLIIGGIDGKPLASVEMFDPVTVSFTNEHELQSPLWDHTATLLMDGRVLLTGGNDGSGHASGCVYRIDPAKREYWVKFCPSAFMLENLTGPLADGCGMVTSNSTERWGQSAINLSDGKVLIVGGYGTLKAAHDSSKEHAQSSEGDLTGGLIYDPSNNELSSNHGFLLAPRRHFAVAPLKDGRWLLIGGVNQYQPAINTAEFYDPSSDEIIPWRDIVNGEK